MPDRHGPYRKMRFLLEIEGLARAGFSRCELPTSRTDVVEYREGNDRPTPRKLWGLSRPEPMVLEAGVSADSMELAEWRQLAERGSLDEARRAIAVVLLDEEGEAGPRWECRNAWPARYEPEPLDARGKDVAIERLEIVHEGFERVE
ncbi:MAG: phage tail protein [Haloferacaceae archaeon]